MNRHIAIRCKLDASPFCTGKTNNILIVSKTDTLDLGGRFRVLASNMENFLIYRKEVTDCASVGLSDQASQLSKLLADKDISSILVQAAIPLLLFRLCLDDLHSCFSGKRTYGQIRAQLREVSDALDQTLSETSKMKSLIAIVKDRVSGNQKATKAIRELQLIFDGVAPTKKKSLNKKLVSAVEELKIKFNKDAEHFFGLCDHLDHDEVLEWTNRRAGTLFLIIFNLFIY